MSTKSEFLTIPEALEYLKENFNVTLSKSRLHHICADKKIVHYKPFKEIIFKKSDLDNYVNASVKAVETIK